MSILDTLSRDTGLAFHIDANRINARARLANMNQLEQLAEKGVIAIEMSESAYHEALAGNDSDRCRKTRRHLASLDYLSTREEYQTLERIQKTLFPAGVKSENEKNDVRMVFNAHKYFMILITADGGSKRQPGGILGHRDMLKNAIGVQIMTDEEAVQIVRDRIKVRDDKARLWAKMTGNPIPSWVGCD